MRVRETERERDVGIKSEAKGIERDGERIKVKRERVGDR